MRTDLDRGAPSNVPAGMPHAFCQANLPNAGLGNKLFVWARAHVFAKLNRLPLRVDGWTRFQLAPILHGFDFRLYWNYFRPVDQVGRQTREYAHRHYRRIADPPVKHVEVEKGAIYEYSKIPSWDNYFDGIREHRSEVHSALLAMLTPARTAELQRAPSPVMVVNVRMGDFRKLQSHERFDQVGGVRTPLGYFRGLVENIRKAHGSRLRAEIVTDGSPRELAELLELPNVSMAPRRSKIIDILMMSRSRILITSAASTFSYWGGFLGECALIMHPDHIHAPIRPEEVNRNSYEGPLVGPPESWPPLFLENLRNIPAV